MTEAFLKQGVEEQKMPAMKMEDDGGEEYLKLMPKKRGRKVKVKLEDDAEDSA